VNQAGSQSPPLVDILVRVLKTISTVFAHTSLITANVPTYGSPWGLALAADRQLNLRPEVAEVDRLLREKTGVATASSPRPGPLTHGGEGTGLKMFDGEALVGMLQSPKYIRDRLATETTVYTLASPPKFLGKGKMGEG
jgi:spermidine synthase